MEFFRLVFCRAPARHEQTGLAVTNIPIVPKRAYDERHDLLRISGISIGAADALSVSGNGLLGYCRRG